MGPDEKSAAPAATRTLTAALAQAVAAEGAGDDEAAIRGFTAVLQRDPRSVAALCGLGRVMLRIESYEEALVCLDKALAIDPRHAESHYRSGIALHLLGRGSEAIERFDRVLGLDPDHFDALFRRSAALADLARFDEAMVGLDRLFELQPNDLAVLDARRFVLAGLGRLDSAQAAYDRVLAMSPEHPGARRRRSWIYLARGKLLEGFRDYEYRWQELQAYANRQQFAHLITRPLNTSAPLWLGNAPLAGKTLLLHHEQGLGDTLQFVRYAAPAAALGARVILGVPPSLRRLLAAMPAVAEVTIRTDALPAHDFHCPVMSLPLAFGTTLDSIPASPYLHADPQDKAAWARRLGSATRPRIGLVWGCGAYPPGRAIPLELLRPLFELDADFISLQKELSDGDSGRLAEWGIAHQGELLQDFADTAALIENLDLVISADTSTAHLAGALGKPVWVLLKFPADWRWLLDRDDSPWYPSARLFRQESAGDWPQVVRKLRQAAQSFLREFGMESAVAEKSAASRRGWRVEIPEDRLLNTAAPSWHGARPLTGATILVPPFLRACRADDICACPSPPAQFDALMGEGIFRFKQGELSAALDCFDEALRRIPGDSGALINRASALASLGRFEEAVACFEQVPPDHPGYPMALLNRANALRHLARYAEALEQLERLLPMRPDDVQVLHDLGFTLARLWRFDEAMVFLDRALASNPAYTTAYVTRAFVLDALERNEEAVADLERALDLKPGQPDVLNNYGNALLNLNRADEALAVFKNALHLTPEDFGAARNCWIAVDKLGQHAQALQLCEQFLNRHPANAGARLDRAICLLSDGRLTEGFADFEARWETSPYKEARLATGAPLWLGRAPLSGKTILLYREQGLGDAIQFARYAPLVAARGARVVLRVPAVLNTLMKSLSDSRETIHVVAEGEPLPPHDCQCPLMSLPLAFDTDLDTVPAQIPYLRADPSRVRLWASRLGGTGRLRLGLAWSGRITPPVIPRRDIPLAMLAPWFDLDVEFVSLQKEMRQADRRFLATLPMVRHGETLEDFADTAALIENLDLVICVDTSVAHVAGAIGKPVWIMNRHDGCWRWLRERSDSPWYPTARLFRQPTLGDWAPVVEQVLRRLREIVESRGSAGRSKGDPQLLGC